MTDETAADIQKPDATDDLTQKLISWFKQDIPHVLEWRKEAREDFQFYANDQWSEEDRNFLREQNRPAMTFNRIAPLVNAVTGSEINNRREVRYIPRQMGAAEANEVLTNAGEWFRDLTDAEDEESDSFADTIIGGMGWTDTRLDFECEPDGAPKIEGLDCFKMVWGFSKKANLADCDRQFYVDSKPLSEAEEMFPNVPPEMLHAGWATTLMQDNPNPHDQTQANFYTGTQNDQVDKYNRKMVTIVEARWLEREPYFRGPDIANPGQMREYAEQQVLLIQKNVPEFKAVRQYRKVCRRAFIGKKVLAPVDSPAVPEGVTGWECITGYRDKIKNQFYGLVRATKDPQRWSNKYFSQTAHLLNAKAKGGVLAERGAFENDREAELSWTKADAITWVKNGALSGQSARIQPKPESQFPAGFWTLFEETKEAINQVTGLSPEFVGTREVDQAGVLEAQRKQSSLSLLAPLFNSLRRYRKRQGRIMLYLIQNYLSDGRLVRIVGKDKAQYVPLTKPDVTNINYDIIVDDAPTAPNEKERTWGYLMQLMPLVKEQVPPQMMLELLKYSPLPASLVDHFLQLAQQAAEQQSQNPQPDPMQQRMAHEQQKAQLDIAGKQIDVQAKQQSAQIDAHSQAMDLFFENQKNLMDQQSAKFQQTLDIQKMALQERQLQLAEQRAANQQTRDATL